MADEGEATLTTISASRDFARLLRQVAAFRDATMTETLDLVVAPVLTGELRRLATRVVEDPPVMVNDIDAGG